MKKSGGTGDDENFYAGHVRDLLASADDTKYTEKLERMFESWSPAFVEYYQSQLSGALTVSGDFASSRLGVVAMPYVGVTNNVSESFNRVLKDFQNWKV